MSRAYADKRHRFAAAAAAFGAVLVVLVAPASASALTVSGFAYADEATPTPTVWSECDGSSSNVALSFNGGAKIGTSCNASTGAFSFTTTFAMANATLVVFLDPAAPGAQGATYTRNADTTSNIVGLQVTRDRLRIRSESETSPTVRSIDAYDSTQDADIPASSNGTTLTVTGSAELHVDSGDRFVPGGDVVTAKAHVAGTWIGWPLERLQLTGSGTGVDCTNLTTMRPLCFEAGGTLTAWTSHITQFTSPYDLQLQAAGYGRLQLQPTSSGWPTYVPAGSLSASTIALGDGTNAVTLDLGSAATTVSAYGDLAVAAGAMLTASTASNLHVRGSLTGAGTIDMAGGSTLEHQPASFVETFGTTVGGPAWQIDRLLVDDHQQPTWGAAGGQTYNSAAANVDRAEAMATAPDGSFYVAGRIGTNGNDLALRKYGPGGALDTTFGTSGMVTYNSAGAQSDFANSVVVDSAGFVYVGGNQNDGASTNWIIRRYTSMGALDTTWGTSGSITYDAGANTDDRVYTLGIDADHNLIVLGMKGLNGGDLLLRRYNAAGVLDTTFGTAGDATYNSGGTQSDLYMGLAILPDRSIIVCGQQPTNGNDWTLRKYTSAGALDTTWGTSGSIVWNSAAAQGDICTALAVGRDGSLYASGYRGTNATDSAIRKYTPAGVLDTTYGTSGMFVYSSGGATQQDVFYRVAIDQHDNLVVTGYQQTNGFDWTVGRITPQGAFDTTFAGGVGYLAYNTGGATTDAPRALAVDREGNITVAGYIAANGNDWSIRRWDAGGNAADGTAGVATSRVTAGSAAITLNDLTLGVATDAATTPFDLESNDRVLDVDDAVDITTRGALTASSTAALTIGGSFTRSGTFTPGTGTVTFDDATKPSTLQYASATTFSGLSVTTPAKLLRFDNVDQTNVTGALTVTGAGCGTGRVQLRSDSAGVQFELNATGTRAVTFADIADSNSVVAASATSSISGGNNTGWTITSCPPSSATLRQFRADGTTPVTFGSWTNDGAATNIVLAFQVADGDGGETLTPWVEVRPSGTPFSIACGTASAGVTFSGSPVSAVVAGQSYPATVNVTGLTNGTTYHWRACARDAGGVASPWLDTARVIDFGVGSGPLATQLTPTEGAWVTSRTPTLTARYDDPQADQGTITFEVCSTNAADPWSGTCGASFQTGTSSTDLPSSTNGSWAPLVQLVEGGTYYWRTRATDVTAATGPYSPGWMFRVDSTPPTIPPNPRAIRRGLGSIEITWDASTDAGSGGIVYDVDTSLDGVTWEQTCEDITVLTCTRGGLGGSQKLFFRVRAIDAAGNVSTWAFIDDSTQTAYYLRTSVASGLLGSAPNRRATVPPLGIGNIGTRVAHGAFSGWYLVRPAQNTASVTSPGEPAGDASFGGTVATPGPWSTSGVGWIIDDYAGMSVAPGPIQVVADLTSSNGAGTGYLQCRVWRIATAANVITSATFLGKQTLTADAIDGRSSVHTCDVAGLPATYTFAANEALYLELWLQVTSGGPGSSTLSLTAEDASSWIAAGTPGSPPSVPTLVAPANTSTTGAAPTLAASYAHPASFDGTIEFQVGTTSGFGTIVESGSSALLAPGNTGSYVVQGSLAQGTTYWYRARAEDGLGRQSAWSAGWSFVIDVGPAAPTNITPANGSSFTNTTPTLTSSAFSDPTGGDSHQATQWQIRTATGSWVSPIADYVSTTALTSWTVAPGLGPSGYAWRVRYRDSYGTWGGWSTATTFTVTGPSVSISVDAISAAMGAMIAGTDGVASSVVTVTTANPTGYTLSAIDGSDSFGPACACGGSVADWSGTSAVPSVWVAGSSGWFGITVRDATGGRLAKWGAGTGTSPGDHVNNRYAGLKQGTSTVLHTSASAAAGATVNTTYRVNPGASTPPGSYAAAVTYTAVANP